MPTDAEPPRGDSAAPAWYPDPRRPGTLRYWNGRTWVEADATQGWYPDPRDRRRLRLWTGTTWGDVLDERPSGGPGPGGGRPVAARTAVGGDDRRVGAVGTGLVAAVGLALGLAGGWLLADGTTAPDQSTSAGAAPGARATAPDTTSGSGTPSGASTTSAPADPSGPEGVEVAAVLSSRSLELADGRRVRLIGLAPTSCDTNDAGKDLLRDAVAGGSATAFLLEDPVSGTTGGYVEVDGRDLGEELVLAGLAEPAVGHPRAPAYAAADARAAAVCSAG